MTDVSSQPPAKLFQENGKRTDVALRFSTVVGGRDSSANPRGSRTASRVYREIGSSPHAPYASK